MACHVRGGWRVTLRYDGGSREGWMACPVAADGMSREGRMACHVRGDGHDFFVLGYYPSRVSLTFNGIGLKCVPEPQFPLMEILHILCYNDNI